MTEVICYLFFSLGTYWYFVFLYWQSVKPLKKASDHNKTEQNYWWGSCGKSLEHEHAHQQIRAIACKLQNAEVGVPKLS